LIFSYVVPIDDKEDLEKKAFAIHRLRKFQPNSIWNTVK
jgi:hypothetical protein